MQAFEIDGMTTRDELRFLAQMAQGIQGNIVEVGTYLGRTAIALAEASGNEATVYAVDPYEYYQVMTDDRNVFIYTPQNREYMLENVSACGFDDKIALINERSPEAAKVWEGGAIDLLFIDALHDYDNVKADFEAWSPFVAERGVIVLHDYGAEPGVTRLCDEMVKSGDYVKIGTCELMIALRKVAPMVKAVKTTTTKKAKEVA